MGLEPGTGVHGRPVPVMGLRAGAVPGAACALGLRGAAVGAVPLHCGTVTSLRGG